MPKSDRRNRLETFEAILRVLVIPICVSLTSGLLLAYLKTVSFSISEEITLNIYIFIIVMIFATCISAVIPYSFYKGKLEAVEVSSEKDDITGIIGPKYVKPKMEENIELARSKNESLSVIIIDIDGFKRINDTYSPTYGYQVGDSILHQFAQTLALELRKSTDILLRYKHGDEFLIIARRTKGSDARLFGERLRRVIEETQFQATETGNIEYLSFSAGVGEFDFKEPLESLLTRAEQKLALAKKTKNCILC